MVVDIILMSNILIMFCFIVYDRKNIREKVEG